MSLATFTQERDLDEIVIDSPPRAESKLSNGLVRGMPRSPAAEHHGVGPDTWNAGFAEDAGNADRDAG